MIPRVLIFKNKYILNSETMKTAYQHIIKQALAVSALLALFTACSSEAKHEQATKEKPPVVASYPTAEIQLMNPEYQLSIPAELKPYEQVAVYAKVSGFVQRLLVDRGDRVRKGQLLAVLEAPEMNQQHLSDKSTEQKLYNDYLYSQQAYERLKQASATSGAVAAIELDHAKSAMESAKSAYESSKAGSAHSSQLQKYLRITAPFDGIITERNVSVGALAGANVAQPMFMMAQGNKLRLTLALPEKHASSVQEGMKASFQVSSQPGKTFDAVLSRSAGMLNQQDRSLTLEFDVNNADGALQGGDYAQAKLRLQRRSSTFWVPMKSVLQTQMGTFVMTLNNQEIKKVPVKEGIRQDSLVEVFGDLAATDLILLKPSDEIKEGKVQL